MNATLNYGNLSNYIPQFLRERYNRVLSMEKSDMISASLAIKGSVIATLRGTGFETKDEVVKELKEKAQQYHGMATVKILNHTREWNYEEACYLRREHYMPRVGGGLAFSISY
ncbi:MAG: hypothetical protein K2J74_00875 [Muribaculaceae bacterium]|nr:hypothetical protein [Muribaculaceae bacterium]